MTLCQSVCLLVPQYLQSKIWYKLQLSLINIDFIVCHWISPPCHGKGECDDHGAVVKTKVKLFLLIEHNHITDAEVFEAFINHNTVKSL